MATERASPIKTTGISIELLELLHELDGASLAQLVEMTGMPKSTVHDHLTTLRDNDFVVTDGDRYRLGFRLFEFGGRLRHNTRLYQVAEPEVQQLAAESGERVNLMIEESNLGVILDIVKGDSAINLDHYLGRRDLLHCTAAGKALLAYLPPARIDDVVADRGLPAVTDSTISNRDDLDDDLRTIRERGYSVDMEERLPGLRCVGAPIRNEEGHAIGGLSLSGPVSRLTEERMADEISELVVRTANVIEINYKYENR